MSETKDNAIERFAKTRNLGDDPGRIRDLSQSEESVDDFPRIGGLFANAFIAKYMILAGLTAPDGGSWLRSIIENPGREAATWLLDLPRFSPGTGYIQFFTALIYLLGLYLLPPAVLSRSANETT